MFSNLTWSIFGGGFVLPYEVGDKHPVSWGRWEHFQAKRIEDGKLFSLFKLDTSSNDALVLEAARNGVKRMRVTKHPRIPSFEWSGETEDKNRTIIYLVTEAVTPLAAVLQELELQDSHRDMFVAMGLRQIAQAVAFLNNQCKLIHGNVCMNTVLVTDTLDWKLGFLDMLSEHTALSTSLLVRCSRFVEEQFKSAELHVGDMEAIASAPPHAVDSWGMGCLMQEVFSNSVLTGKEQLRDMSSIPKEVLSEYQKLLSVNPSRRLNTSKLSDCEFLKNDLVDVVQFLESLSIREVMEKDKFFRNLPKHIPLFPPAICTRKLLPLLCSALEYGGAPAMALGCLLQVGKMLSEEEFKTRVVPIISALFSSQDRSIRRSLINAIDEYAPALTQQVVEASIYPQLCKGLAEPNAYLREQTLKAMLPLAPKLGQRTINTSLLKQLARLQVDEEPSIRANTTVLLGNIAPLLGETACKRILLNAFTRALKDVFPASRVAALRALMATARYHSPHDVATRVVPAVSPMMLDPTADVRTAACKVLEFFVKSLTKASGEMDRGLDPTKAEATGEAPDKTSQVTSYLEWAMSTIAAAAGASAGTPNATPIKPAAPARSSSLALSPQARSGSVRAARDDAPSSRRNLGASGWGDMDDNFEELPASGGQGGAASSTDFASAPAASAGDGWGDDLWGEITATLAPDRPRKAEKKSKLGVTKRDGKGE